MPNSDLGLSYIKDNFHPEDNKHHDKFGVYENPLTGPLLGINNERKIKSSKSI